MFAKSVNKTFFCLAYILDITSRACDAIYNVVAFAINSNFATIAAISGFLCDLPFMINFRAISTVFGFTRVRVCYFVRIGSIIWFIWVFFGLYKVEFEVFSSS